MPYMTDFVKYQSLHSRFILPIQFNYFFYAEQNGISSVKCCCPPRAVAQPQIKNNICFPEKINGGEDYVVCVKLLTMADSVRCVDRPLYYYNRINPTSIISTPSKSKIYEQIRATELIEQFLKDKNIISDYTRELDIRKFRSKFPLLRSNHIEWYSVFPESNYVYKYLKLGLRNKLYMIVANVDAKIKSRIKW